jgi:accessory gene regulator B
MQLKDKQKEDIEVYDYSLQILFSTVFNFVAVVAIALVTKTVWLSFIYLFGFIPLRLTAGGYHAKNHFRCFLVLMGTYAAFLLAVFFLPELVHQATAFAAIAVSLVLIVVLAPVEDKNKPLSADEVKSFKKKSRVAIVLYAVVIACLLLLLSKDIYGLSLSLGVLSVALSLLASKIKNRIVQNRH